MATDYNHNHAFTNLICNAPYNRKLYSPSMTPIAELIAESRKAAGLSQSELARRLNLTPQSVQAWESGRSAPRSNMLVDIAVALGISKVALFSAMLQTITKPVFAKGEAYIESQNQKALALKAEIDALSIEGGPAGEVDADVVQIPFITEAIPPLGGPSTVEVDRFRSIRLDLLLLGSGAMHLEKAVCATVHGDGMMPILPDGTVVVIDQESIAIRDGKIYALDHNGQIRVKTLSRIPGGGLRLRSFNKEEYPDEEYSPEQLRADHIKIIGRVIWSSTSW